MVKTEAKLKNDNAFLLKKNPSNSLDKVANVHYKAFCRTFVQDISGSVSSVFLLNLIHIREVTYT